MFPNSAMWSMSSGTFPRRLNLMRTFRSSSSKPILAQIMPPILRLTPRSMNHSTTLEKLSTPLVRQFVLTAELFPPLNCSHCRYSEYELFRPWAVLTSYFKHKLFPQLSCSHRQLFQAQGTPTAELFRPPSCSHRRYSEHQLFRPRAVSITGYCVYLVVISKKGSQDLIRGWYRQRFHH